MSYTYHTQGALDSVTAGSTSYVRRTIYDASGRVELRELGWNGSSPTVKVDYDYFAWDTPNGQGRLKQIKAGTTADATSLLDLRYFSGTNSPAYDALGNLLNIYDHKMGSPQTQSFTYDNLDRLTSASVTGGSLGLYSENYTYDNNTGNLTSKGGVSYYYEDPSHDHAVTRLGNGNTYGYDANGNMTQRNIGGVSYTLEYDAENRLTTVKQGVTTIAAFSYDGDGVRVKGTVNGVTTAYVGEILEWTGSTSSMVKYYYAGSNRVAMKKGTTLYWLIGDHLSSTSVVANSSGGLHSKMLYKAWGETRHTYGTLPTKRQYTSQVNETGIGLYFYNARWYDSYLNRWTQPDSIIPNYNDPQSFDRYAFVRNNPVNRIDPTGHMDICPECGGGSLEQTLLYFKKYVKHKDIFNNYYATVRFAEESLAESLSGGLTKEELAILSAYDAAIQNEHRNAVNSLAQASVTSSMFSTFHQPLAVRAVEMGFTLLPETTNPREGDEVIISLAGAGGVVVYQFVQGANGILIPVPAEWIARSASNGQGMVYQRPGAIGNADSIRIMDPNAQYPNGYVRYYNSYGQPLTVDGKPGPNSTTHIPLEYQGPLADWPIK